ncbi:MAG: hypothetical protein K5888_10540 [Lachnospiraceae bacterium]|nr:hypothetical protein [Lachnospiraceae bacterium]
MKLTNKEKTELLLQRGFTEEEIKSRFKEYRDGQKQWLIATITIDEVLNSDDSDVLMRLFAKDSSSDSSICSTGNGKEGFGIFASKSVGFDVAAAVMEPYIAAFVREVNECGAYTCMSCDGWHAEYDGKETRPVQLWMKERFSAVWMWLIMEFVFGEKWKDNETYIDRLSWDDQWEPNPYDYEENTNIFESKRLGVEEKAMMIYRITPGRERKAYEKIYKYSRFLKEHRQEILQIKEKVIAGMRSEKDETEWNYYASFLEIRRVMAKYAQEDLEKLGQECK